MLSAADNPTINVPLVAVPRPSLALAMPALPAELPGGVADVVALLEAQQQAFQDASQTAVTRAATLPRVNVMREVPAEERSHPCGTPIVALLPWHFTTAGTTAVAHLQEQA